MDTTEYRKHFELLQHLLQSAEALYESFKSIMNDNERKRCENELEIMRQQQERSGALLKELEELTNLSI